MNSKRPNSIIRYQLDKKYSEKNQKTGAEEIENISLDVFKKLIRYQVSDTNEKIAGSVILIFYFKDIQKYICENKCSKNICQEIPCKLKEIFIDTIRSTKSSQKYPQVGLTTLIHSFIQMYQGSYSFESTLDIFLLFLHSFSVSNCFEIKPGFVMRVKSEFSCQCGKKKAIINDINFFAVQVKSFTDFIGESLQKVFKTQQGGQSYSFCANSVCQYKKSKKNMEITELPTLVIFKLVWNEEVDSHYINTSIKPEFNISEFNSELNKQYKISVVFLQNDYLYLEERAWKGKDRFFNNFETMIDQITRNSERVFGVAYIRNLETLKPSSNSLNYPVMSSPLLKKEECSTCHAAYKELCKCPRLCDRCKKNTTESGIFCNKCQDVRYSTFSSQKCCFCSNSISEGIICQSCKIKKNESSLTISNKKYVDSFLTCKNCKASIRNGICSYCSTASSSLICPKCRLSDSYICTACKSKSQTKRASSSISIRKKCEQCTSVLLKDDDLYCNICTKKCDLGGCVYCKGQHKFICGKCLRKKSPYRNYHK